MKMFGVNVWLIIGALILLVAGLILLISVWTGVKIVWWRADQRRAERMMHQKRFAPDGTPLPPSSRGICTICNRALPLVYHTQSGDRLCPDHYHMRAKDSANHSNMKRVDPDTIAATIRPQAHRPFI